MMKKNKSIIVNISLALLAISMVACTPKPFHKKWLDAQAPEYFKARFETTEGNFDIEARREWSPKAVDRLYALIKTGFYTDIALFRVVDGFVAQFGIQNDSALNVLWQSYKIPDEPVVEPNTKGALAFARGGEETRSTQLFINLENNSPRLDTISYNGVTGFPVVARVIRGMDVVESFYSEYAEQPSSLQSVAEQRGNEAFKEQFPKLDYILKAYIIKK